MRERHRGFFSRVALAALAGLLSVQCGGDGSSPAGTATDGSPADYMYLTGADSAWGFRFVGSGDALQVVPGSPMFFRRIPVFHPQGRVAVVESGPTLTLHTVNADGGFASAPLQTISLTAAVTNGPALQDIGFPVWNADGTMMAVSGFDVANVADVNLFFFAYSNGRLTPVPGTPFTTRSASMEGGFLGDVFYNFQLNGINAYRVSPTHVESIQVLPRSNAGERLRFIGDRVVVVGVASYLRQADGTLRAADRINKPSTYAVQESRTFEAGPRSILYQGIRVLTGDASIFVATFGDDGTITSLTDEAVLGRPLGVNIVRGVARNGRVIFTSTSPDPVLRAWFIRDDHTFAPSQPTTVSLGDAPGSTLWAVDRTQEFMYTMSTNLPGMVGLRVGADGRTTTFDVPAANSFRIGATYAVAYNTR